MGLFKGLIIVKLKKKKLLLLIKKFQLEKPLLVIEKFRLMKLLYYYQKTMTIMQNQPLDKRKYIVCAHVCWKLKIQKFTARNTTETEFNAIADFIKKFI